MSENLKRKYKKSQRIKNKNTFKKSLKRKTLKKTYRRQNIKRKTLKKKTYRRQNIKRKTLKGGNKLTYEEQCDIVRETYKNQGLYKNVSEIDAIINGARNVFSKMFKKGQPLTDSEFKGLIHNLPDNIEKEKGQVHSGRHANLPDDENQFAADLRNRRILEQKQEAAARQPHLHDWSAANERELAELRWNEEELASAEGRERRARKNFVPIVGTNREVQPRDEDSLKYHRDAMRRVAKNKKQRDEFFALPDKKETLARLISEGLPTKEIEAEIANAQAYISDAPKAVSTTYGVKPPTWVNNLLRDKDATLARLISAGLPTKEIEADIANARAYISSAAWLPKGAQVRDADDAGEPAPEELEEPEHLITLSHV